MTRYDDDSDNVKRFRETATQTIITAPEIKLDLEQKNVSLN